MANGSVLLAWQRVVLHESQCQYLSPLKENGVNRGVKRSAGSDYTMDEVAAYNEEYDSQSSMIMQGARNTADYVTRRHVIMAIKLVYQLQSDEENWTRWPDLLEHYHEVQAKSFYNIVERMEENLPIQPPVAFTIYKKFSMIDFSKFKKFYSESEWNILMYKVDKIHAYYVRHKEVISKHKYSKHYVYPTQTTSYFE